MDELSGAADHEVQLVLDMRLLRVFAFWGVHSEAQLA